MSPMSRDDNRLAVIARGFSRLPHNGSRKHKETHITSARATGARWLLGCQFSSSTHPLLDWRREYTERN